MAGGPVPEFLHLDEISGLRVVGVFHDRGFETRDFRTGIVNGSDAVLAVAVETDASRGMIRRVEVLDVVRLEHNPDRQLVESGKTAVSSDSWVLDHCASWANVTRTLIEARIPGAHLIDLRSG